METKQVALKRTVCESAKTAFLCLALFCASFFTLDRAEGSEPDFTTPGSFSPSSYSPTVTGAYPSLYAQNASRKGETPAVAPANSTQATTRSNAYRPARANSGGALVPAEPLSGTRGSAPEAYRAAPGNSRALPNSAPQPSGISGSPLAPYRPAPSNPRYASVVASESTGVVVTTRETIARAVVPNASSSAPASTSSLPQTTASPGAGRLETLEDATRIAISESRVRRALALKNGASRSTVEAARSLKNPKITNATSYVGVLNQPAAVSDVDLTSAASGVAQMIPGPIMDLISPLVSQIPTNYQIETPLCDKDFVTTVTAVTIPIYLGGRVNALTRAAEAMAQATQAGEEVGEQAVKIQVSEAYFLVLRTRRLHQVAVEAVETARSHRDDAERMFNVGLIARNVVLAANVALAEASQLELKVANARQLAEAAYNRLLWRPLDAPVLVADMELGAPLGDLETLTAQAVRARAELQVLSAESRALQEQEKVARADALPQVVATGAYSYIENSHLSDNSNATAAVGMVWTPFDGGTSRARQRAARQNAMAVAQARDEAESGIRLQVRQAWLAEQEARRRVEVAKAAVEQAEENLRVVTRGFQEGTVNHTETLDAATMRTTATSAYANALYDAILATQRLRYAVGIL